ncbi:hypothetical protein, partial [Helicobacter sp. 13S00482-2]|uniref:hypothetical protein n=1 Tax=Helicobacter sp. 13S00482-2 TaxID=1476200 RepID=UPI001C5F2D24
ELEEKRAQEMLNEKPYWLMHFEKFEAKMEKKIEAKMEKEKGKKGPVARFFIHIYNILMFFALPFPAFLLFLSMIIFGLSGGHYGGDFMGFSGVYTFFGVIFTLLVMTFLRGFMEMCGLDSSDNNGIFLDPN